MFGLSPTYCGKAPQAPALLTAVSSCGGMSYIRHAFHYVVEGGVTYMCMAEKNEKQRIPFKFLKDIKSKFQHVQPPPHSSLPPIVVSPLALSFLLHRSSFDAAAIRSEVAFGMNRPFKRVLTERMVQTLVCLVVGLV